MKAEDQVRGLITKLFSEGVWVKDPRTEENTLSLFDNKIVIEAGHFPWFTGELASPRLAFEEMWFFLRGDTDTKLLEDKGINFWRGNTSREALDKVGLYYLNEGEMGSAYSLQWRQSGGYNRSASAKLGKSLSNGFGEDQFINLLKGLRDNKYGRRHLVTLWNPSENGVGCITPCWHTSTWVVLPNKAGEDELNVKLNNRSLDSLFGAKYALMQYKMLQMVLCKVFGFKEGKISSDLSNYHLYENQIEYAEELLTRECTPHENNSIKLKDCVKLDNFQDILDLQWEDWEVVYEYNREPFKTERPQMVA